MKIVVTGASGFVGKPAVSRLRAVGHEVVPIVRHGAGIAGERVVNDLARVELWRPLLDGADAVLHLAAQTQTQTLRGGDFLDSYRNVNVLATTAVARAARDAGVCRFVFMSSIKVNGESTKPGHPFRRFDVPAPTDPYGISKLEAELALVSLLARGLEVVVIRPPLIYGPGVKGNFAHLMSAVRRGFPLPFRLITENRRSLIGIRNLLDLTERCLTHPRAAGQVYLASDGIDVSTRRLIEMIAAASERKARLLPVPSKLLLAAGALVGKSESVHRLIDSLQVDISETRAELDWKPPVSMQEEIEHAVTAEAISAYAA